MTDNLRDAAQAVLDRWDSTDWKAAPTAEYMNRLRAALAVAPQPGLCDCELSHNGLGMSGRECDCPAGSPQRAPDRDALVEVIEAAAAACPQHVGFSEAIADDLLARGLRLPGTAEPGLREAAQLGLEMAEANDLHHTAEKIREALKRRESRGWGVVVEGDVVWVDVDADQRIAETVADEEGGKAVRVAIRVVEGGDDA